MLVLGLFTLMTAVALPQTNIPPVLLNRMSAVAFLYARTLSLNVLHAQTLDQGVGIFGGLFHSSLITNSFDFLMLSVRTIIILFLSHTLDKKEYGLIALFSISGASLLVSSSDLISIYLSIELQSFAVYIMATLYRNSESATSAGLKYFLLGGLSSALILLGSVLVYANTGLTTLEGVYALLSVSNDNTLAVFGLTVLAVGLLFKVSAAPFHHWSPDVYDNVPTNVTTWLAIMPKISVFVLLLELQVGLSGTLTIGRDSIDVWKNLLLVCSLLSLVFGTVVGLSQYRIKRLLAYSTISHVGFLLLALAVNSEESIEGFLFYIGQYTLTNVNAFLILIRLGYSISKSTRSSDVEYISQLAGQFRVNPLLGFSFAVTLFSLAGIPPLVGFFGKQMVLYSAVHRGYYFLSFAAIVVSVISASYYLKVVRVIHFDTVSVSARDTSGELTGLHAYGISVLTLATTLFVLKPSIVLNSTTLLALTLFPY